MKPNLLFLTIVAVFLILIPQEVEALSTDSYDTVNITTGQSRQPSTSERVFLVVVGRIDTTTSLGSQTARYDVQISPDNSTWETIPTIRSGASLTAIGITLGTQNDGSMSFIIPTAYYYRILLTNESGVPNSTIIRVKEILQDKKFTDPINQFSCSNVEPSQVSYCSFVSLNNNFTYRNDLVWNYSVYYPNGTIFVSGQANNTNTRGRYNFNFTATSTEQDLEVEVFNMTIQYSISTMVEVDYKTLRPEQNATLYSIVPNITQAETDINLSINQTGNAIILNQTTFSYWILGNFSNYFANVFGNLTAIKNETNYIYHNLTDGSVNVSVDLTPVFIAINDSEQRIKLNVTAEHTITRALINAVNSTLYGRIALVVIDVFSYLMTNGDTYQEFIEGLDQNVTQFHDEEMTAIDNINVSFGNLTINQTLTTVAIAPRQKCLGLC